MYGIYKNLVSSETRFILYNIKRRVTYFTESKVFTFVTSQQQWSTGNSLRNAVLSKSLCNKFRQTFHTQRIDDEAEKVDLLLNDLDNLSEEQKKEAFWFASKSASKGSFKGKLLLGALLRCGIGTCKDEEEAFKVLEPLAEANDAHACFLCGDILEQFFENQSSFVSMSNGNTEEGPSAENSLGSVLLQKDTREKLLLKAISYYEKSVSCGNDYSLLALGNAYLKLQHPEKAKEVYLKAIEKGLSAAYVSLGTLFLYGVSGKYSNVEQDGIKASKYLLVVAEEGNPEAQFLLGSLYLSGVEPLEPDESTALKYLELAAAAEHREACYLLARTLLEKEELDSGSIDVEKVLNYVVIASEKGHSDACYLLGDIYYQAGSNSTDIGRENFSQALEWFKKSGSLGNPEGYYIAASMYLQGLGSCPDTNLAVKLLKSAGNMNHSPSLRKLSVLHRNGAFNILKSEEKADYYLNEAKAIERRNWEALSVLERKPSSIKKASRKNGLLHKRVG